ncbi:MAG: hypothetical protein IJ009_05650 [Clostridia bacterium]|nr:hypothetical protein [Clostridia bacterium]
MKLTVQELSIEQKLGMLFCARRFQTEEDLAFTLDLIRRRALGSVQVPINDETPAIMQAVREAADYPILIINDMEQGYPRADLPQIPALTLAAADNEDYSRAFAKAVVATAKAEGFNGTWGPILDLILCDGPCRVSRCFGDTPDAVLRTVWKIADVFREYGFMSTGKHYPGRHDCPFDTHMAEGISYADAGTLKNVDLVPYIKLMKEGLLPAIMTAHHSLPNIDPENPASASKKVIDLIRELGFDGVCFTDSLAMMGILQKYGEENVMGKCIAAGNDIVLPNYRTPTKQSFAYLEANYRDGSFDEARLDEAARRVIELQNTLAKRADALPTLTERDIECLHLIAHDAITAVTDEGLTASLGDTAKRRLFAIVAPDSYDESTPTEEIQITADYDPRRVAAKIKAEFPNAEVVFVPEHATPKENERVLVAATRHDEVVFVTFCVTSPYLGTDCLTRRTEALINALGRSGKVSAVVHYGNPYAVTPLSHQKRLIFGYTAPESQEYAIEVLAGKYPAKGKLPFALDLA